METPIDNRNEDLNLDNLRMSVPPTEREQEAMPNLLMLLAKEGVISEYELWLEELDQARRGWYGREKYFEPER